MNIKMHVEHAHMRSSDITMIRIDGEHFGCDPERYDDTHIAEARKLQAIVSRVVAIAHEWMAPGFGDTKWWNDPKSPEMAAIRKARMYSTAPVMSVSGMSEFGREGLTDTALWFWVPTTEADEWVARISEWVRQAKAVVEG